MGKEDFLNAVKNGDSQYVRKILHKYRKGNRKGSSKRVGINYADADGFTALHYAALSGDVEIVMAIIHMEADPNIRDLKGMTPLHMSAWAGKPEAIACLLENRALPNLPAFSGDTPLHLAAQHGYAACAKVLLSAQGDGCFRNGFLETPLDLACQYGHTAVVKELLVYEEVREMLQSPVIDNRFKSPLHLSSKSGHDDIVHMLLKAGANVNELRAEGTPLHLAALYGKTEAVKLLLRAGADVTIRNNNNLLPLDVVNKFTTSRAALEIKQLLREAAGEHVVYAKAICDYSNPSFKNSITFKANECIAVIERNEDGCWKGYVVNSKHEKIGYFPSMTVQLIAKTKKTMSISSFSSQTSSADSTSGRSTASGSSPEKGPVSPKNQPVGVVPVGSYEVVALSQADPEYHSFPKQTANGCFVAPGMGSFKQKNNNNKTLQRSFSAQTSPTHLNRLPVATDKRNIRSASTDETESCLQRHALDEYHTKSLSDDGRLKYAAQTMSRQINKSNYGSPTDFRYRTSSSGAVQSESHKVHPPPVVMSPNTRHLSPSTSINKEYSRSTPQSPNNRPRAQTTVAASPAKTKQELARNCSSPYSSNHVRARSQSSSSGGGNAINSELTRAFQEQTLRRKGSIKYANVQTTPTSSPVSKEPYQPTDYATVYVTDGEYSDQNLSPSHEKTKLKPILSKSGSFRKTMSSDNSDYENIFDSKPKSNSVSFARTPEEKRKMQAEYGYEVMNPATTNSSSTQNSEIYSYPTFSGTTSQHFTPSQEEEEAIYENTVFDSEDGKRHLIRGDEVITLDQKLSNAEKDLLKWLTDLKLQCYLDNFTKHGFDTISMRAVTPEDLNIMEITKTGHRKKILSEVAKLPPSDQLPNKKPHDVGSWLGALNLRQYEPNFIEGGFDDIDFIKDLDRNDLEMIDIKKKGHQKKILMAVQCLHDLELTAILDQAVLPTSPEKFSKKRIKTLSRESPVVRSSSLRREVRPEIQEFFAATSQSPTYTMSSANYPLSPRDDLPPPSGEEQIGISPNHNGTIPKVAPKPTKKPVPVPDKQKPPKPGIVPRTKPKPAVKPVRSFGNSNGQMDDLTSNIGRVSMNAPSQLQGDQDEQVTSSKSRDFFKRQEVDTSPNNSLTRDRTASNSSSSSNTSNETRTRAPLGSSRPPLIKMKPALSTDQRSFGDAPPTPPKKVPPPAPPKRRSSSKTKETKAPEVTIIHNPPSPQPPSPQLSDFLPPPPLVSPPPKEISEPSSPLPPPPSSLSSSSEMGMGKITPEPSPAADNQAANIEQNPPKKENVDESFSETENIMADIMADIDDFSAQLDSMF